MIGPAAPAFRHRYRLTEEARLEHEVVPEPEPAIFLEAAQRMGVAPARAVVVEDALAGVEAGRRGGFGLVVGVDRAGFGGELAERGADIVVGDLGELLAASAPAS
jgi:alpha,alpha-trehalose phosphorylase